MNKIMIGLILLGTPVCSSLTGQEFRLDPKKDVPIAAAAVLFSTASVLIDSKEGEQTSRRDINSFDSPMIRPYSESLDLIGTAGSCLSLIAPGSLALFSGVQASDLLTYGTMYSEAFLLTYGIKGLIKDAVPRWRPYTYSDENKEEDDDYNSFPSGHTAYAFLGATFLTTILYTDFRDSPWTLPLSVGTYAVAVTTGTLRVASGEHFITDVLAGAALGSLMGWLVPAIHKYNPWDDASLNLEPVPGGLCLSVSLHL